MSEAADDFPRLVSLPSFSSEHGLLYIAEGRRELGFTPRRFYFMTDVPRSSIRGIHAHKSLRQGMICLRGSVTVELEKGGRQFRFRLERPDQCLVVPPGCWRVIRDFSDAALVGVLASEEYDESDYIYKYDEFRQWEATTAANDGVPYLDLSRTYAALEAEIDTAVSRVLGSGRYIGGTEVEAFERDFAAYCGVTHAVGVANGLDALTLALTAGGIGHGHSVILPANSFIATALAVSRTGAMPILVDVEEDTANIDPRAVSAAIRLGTRAIIPVHLYGHPADMDPLRVLAERHELFLLEDAAQAHGARYRGQRCGSLGDAAAFSFYPTKNLGALGDAGAVVSPGETLARDVRRLGNYGAEQRDNHVVKGVNSRLDPVQAAVLSAKLTQLDRWNARRRALAERYRAGLTDCNEVVLPTPRAWAEPVWHVFSVRVRNRRRDALKAHLEAFGIGCNIHYPRPIHLQPAYRDLGLRQGAFPVAEQLASESLSLPLDHFHDPAEIDRVVDGIRKFFRPA